MPEPDDTPDDRLSPHTAAGELEDADELPVVARMVVEIRSDGSRTIARGAVEDRLSDQQVAVEARADSPLELSRALTKLLLSAPFAASSALLGRQRAQPHEQADSSALDLRGRAGELGRRLGERLGRRLQRRLGAQPGGGGRKRGS